jgi:hypothetical protein
MRRATSPLTLREDGIALRDVVADRRLEGDFRSGMAGVCCGTVKKSMRFF